MISKMPSIIFAIFMALTSLSYSTDGWAGEAEKFLRFFSGNCIRSVHNLDQLIAYAEVQKWQRLPEDMQRVFENPFADESDGWGVTHEGQFYIVGYTKGFVDGESVSSCAVVSKSQMVGDVAQQLNSRFQISEVVDEVEGFQRYQTFTTNVSGIDLLITILSGDTPEPGTVILTAQHFEKPKDKVLSCSLTERQKSLFRDQMCRSSEYGNFYGDDCMEQHLKKRAEDSGIQVQMGIQCGYLNQAARLEESLLESITYVGELYKCIDAPLNAKSVYRDGFENGKLLASKEPCTSSMKSKMKRRLPELIDAGIAAIKMGKEMKIKLGIEYQ
jgi:hypothetical protein